jgi:hypothetical protein
MSGHVLELFFYAAATLMFGIFGFVPKAYPFLNKHALVPISDRYVKLLQKFSIFVCISCFCQFIWALWKAFR